MGEPTTIDDDLHPVQEFDVHPFAELFPVMGKDAFEALAASIRRDGLLQPIVLMSGKIIDGRHRYRACRAVGRPLYRGEVQEFHGSEAEAIAYVTALNLERRHLTPGQRAMIAAELATRTRGRQRAGAPAPMSTGDAANKLKVSDTLVDTARKVKREAEPHIVDMVRAGTIKLAQAQAVAKLDPAAQRSLTTPEQVTAAAAGGALLPRGLARKTPESLVALIVGAAGELAIRGDLRLLAAGIQPQDARAVVERLDSAIKQLGDLRHAVRARMG
jgi:ParB-like chromosome segregation protein Spo0J